MALYVTTSDSLQETQLLPPPRTFVLGEGRHHMAQIAIAILFLLVLNSTRLYKPLFWLND